MQLTMYFGWTIFCGLIVAISNIQGAPVSDDNDPYAEDMKNRKIMALECIKEVNIDKSIIEKVLNTESLPKRDRKYKQFLACSYKKQGYQTEDGKMIYDNIKKFLTRFYTKSELAELDKCKTISGDDDAEMAFNHLECIMSSLRQVEATREENNEV